ncbi:alanine--tRNA ligase [Methanorbis rubei]|uniref:Alanine--tRNA ligase n=1 Tax=Methanorbis rubei TaxID=3028300 RepID=A0AAE4MH71_9EURY|nr:Alanine--tRNA ligase [Methanocorpusculaceae archaeon Cs1]
MLENEYQLDYFKREGFVRKICKKCGMPFWTRDPEREICGDAPCEPYQFIGNPLFKRHTVEEMREAYLSYFEKNGHTRVGRYPVAARWRDDIYLTIASIADFQPYVTSGVCPPPANPLTISQPCIRLNDLDNVGRSGRHFTCFEMMAHHAFNTDENTIYWKDHCVELCSGFIESIGGDLNNLTFKENPWFGGGNAGASVEVLMGGLEVATLVFMNLSRKNSGKPQVMIDGKDYYEMPLRIVDTGYGLERFAWASQGTPTAYDAVFPEMIPRLLNSAGMEDTLDNPEVARILGMNAKFAGLMDIRGEKIRDLRQKVADATGVSLTKLEEIIIPMENIYALCDHTRCLAYMLGDLIVPSNVREGYLARLVLRRSIRMMQEAGVDEDLGDLIIAQMEKIGLSQFEQEPSIVREIISREVEKYDATIERGTRTVQRIGQNYVKKSQPVPLDELITLYDSHGIPVELMKKILTETGAEFEIPDDFDSQIADMHSENEGEKPESPLAKYAERIAVLPATRKSYYERPSDMEFEATIIDVIDEYVILDHTLFYPEGGGQPSDTGTFVSTDAMVRVDEVLKSDDVILHKVRTQGLKRGDRIKGVVDEERRWALMRHHSGTHVILRAAKEILGPHVHQAGSQLSTDAARLDIRHYTHITPEQLKQIEIVANRLVMENLLVMIKVEPRTKAEQKFGFALYQGGVPPGKELRVVQMGAEVQACAGTHCQSTGEIGPIKLLRLEHIQDGVERIEFAAGFAALDAMQHLQTLLAASADTLSVQTENLPSSVERFFSEWKDQRKEIERLRAKIAELELSRLEGVTVSGVEVVVKQVDVSRKELVTVAGAVAGRGGVAVLITTADGVGVVASSGVPEKVNAGKLVSEVCAVLGGKGGGKESLAQGAGVDALAVPAALTKAEELVSAWL